jgi:hypothetical protein
MQMPVLAHHRSAPSPPPSTGRRASALPAGLPPVTSTSHPLVESCRGRPFILRSFETTTDARASTRAGYTAKPQFPATFTQTARTGLFKPGNSATASKASADPATTSSITCCLVASVDKTISPHHKPLPNRQPRPASRPRRS